MAMTLRLTREQDTVLTLLARVEGVSKQEAATRAIVAAARRTLVDAEARRIAEQAVDSELALLRSLL
nr:CopG family transcriptional regulator [Corynebacterium lactis]